MKFHRKTMKPPRYPGSRRVWEDRSRYSHPDELEKPSGCSEARNSRSAGLQIGFCCVVVGLIFWIMVGAPLPELPEPVERYETRTELVERYATRTETLNDGRVKTVHMYCRGSESRGECDDIEQWLDEAMLVEKRRREAEELETELGSWASIDRSLQ